MRQPAQRRGHQTDSGSGNGSGSGSGGGGGGGIKSIGGYDAE